MNAWNESPAAWDARLSWMGAASAASTQVGLLMRVLDEIDYGVLLADANGALRYANQLGLRELCEGGTLRLQQGRLSASAAGQHGALALALADAQRGRRRLFSLGHNGSAVSVAAVPVPVGEDDAGETLALLVFGKRPASDTLTLDFYARSHALTAAELVVLKSICGGLKPKDVARAQGVAISTVRSHICSIRAKTHAGSIRELVNRMALLPPITPVMKLAVTAGDTPAMAAVTH